jgi:hypothetical protein
MELSIERIPTWSFGYVVNGDKEGLTDNEVKMVDDYFRENKVVSISPVEEDEETGARPYFSRYPAFGGLACEVEDCVVACKE